MERSFREVISEETFNTREDAEFHIDEFMQRNPEGLNFGVKLNDDGSFNITWTIGVMLRNGKRIA